LAKELMTLDDLSGGRIALGIGSGGTGWDATALGQVPWSVAERTERFEEFVALLDRVLSQPATSHQGRWYSAEEARSVPGCMQQPRVPFTVAAMGPRGMRVAARHGQAWVTADGDVADQVRLLEEACAAIGRDPATIDRMVLTGFELDAGLDSPEHFRDTCGRYEAMGITDLVVHWPRATEPFAGDEAAFERAVS
jgi:alkanesulfonate monooxygenase SsuD/methylene tetrahydromethanopterin reductase-like flavin-dependent oxidoreductase (luciferase family)